ncbi:mechanosensitive ion channel domain-containing protein [Butyrivibrio sp. AE3004]|uniref:mechanosensitive ion channel domain-containing protein n=1 Tax=Butyrivibrio sp. AE3004 TaxID=1506994 RepID=UPI00068A305D|nr:mechanosensitive ion channel domain-containing protein [Butyrivibrio sp. AE3004]
MKDTKKSKTKATIRLSKLSMHIILIIATIVFSVVSFMFFFKDMETKLIPQVNRAIIQVSKILPQLQENEDALREINAKLEKSREDIYKHNKDALYDRTETDEESVESVIEHTLSWMNRVTKLRVGRGGHVLVVSKDDLTILAHPDETFIGSKLELVFGDTDKLDVPDLEEMSGKLTEEDIANEYGFFIPAKILDRNLDLESLSASMDEGIIGSTFSYRDTYIICGETLRQAISFIVFRCFFATLIFYIIGWVIVRYIGFCFAWQKYDNKNFRRKIISCTLIAVVIYFSTIWYYQEMSTMTGDLATMNQHARVAVETLNTYRDYRKELSEWLDSQYLDQCRLAAQLVLSKGKNNVTRKDLAEYAKDLDVEYIYVFDKNGKVMVTNSPYDHFVLSNDPDDQSYAFRTLLDGTDYVIQDPRDDESEGEYKQYIGVSIRDENDLADGFVQVAIDPSLRERLIGPIDVQTVLDNMVIGLPKYALAINKDDMTIAATTGLGYENASVEDIGLDVEEIRGDYNGIEIINGDTYYAGISETEDLYLMPICKSTDNTNVFFISLKMAAFFMVTCILIVLIAIFAYKRIFKNIENTESKAAEEGGANNGNAGTAIFNSLNDIIKVQEKFGFEERWENQSTIPVNKQPPEMRIKKIIYRILLVFSSLLIAYEFLVIMAGVDTRRLDGFAYVLLGNWDEGLNLFSFSYCLFLFCVLYVFKELLNQILYSIARITDLRTETMLLLFKNAIKYAAALLFLYMGLAKFGVDTRTLWASAGVLSLMVGFGAKDLVNDIIAGIFIIFEGTLKIGDYVIIGGWGGIVKEIGIRSTKVVSYADTKIFNNSSIKDVINCNGEVAKEVVKFPIAYDLDLLEIEKLLEEELPKISENIVGLVKPLRYEGVNAIEDGCVMLRIRLYVIPRYSRKAARAVLREIKILFDKNGIGSPFNYEGMQRSEDESDSSTDSSEEEEDSDDDDDDDFI